MAGLTSTPDNTPQKAAPPPFSWTASQSRTQFAALARLRWQLFLNGFHRKGGKGELVARLILLPVVTLVAVLPIAVAGFCGYLIASQDKLNLLLALTWGIFILWQLVSINLTPAALSFDINIIIRFPLSFTRYLAARLLFGLLSPSNVIGTLATLAAFIGISIGRPSLAAWAALPLAIYTVSNIFFTRMIFAWIDRWLATRRAREVLTAGFLFISLGFQYLNVTFNPGLQNKHHHASTHLPFLLKVFHYLSPVAILLPPGLAATSMEHSASGRYLTAAAALAGLVAFSALFLYIYAWRMRREFHGEDLSELHQPPQKSAPSAQPPIVRTASIPGLSPVLSACLHKELLYLRRTPNQLYGFLAPVFMVLLFAGRLASNGALTTLLFPCGVAYSMLGISILCYNAFGADASGFQLYLIAPVSMRQVFLAKNLLLFTLALVEFALIYAIVSFTSAPPYAIITLTTLLWLTFTTLINTAIGNLRSIVSPMRTAATKIAGKQVSQLSTLFSLGIAISSCALGFGIYLWTTHIGAHWLMLPIFAALDLAALTIYLVTLNRLDQNVLAHRENLIEVLNKA